MRILNLHNIDITQLKPEIIDSDSTLFNPAIDISAENWQALMSMYERYMFAAAYTNLIPVLGNLRVLAKDRIPAEVLASDVGERIWQSVSQDQPFELGKVDSFYLGKLVQFKILYGNTFKSLHQEANEIMKSAPLGELSDIAKWPKSLEILARMRILAPDANIESFLGDRTWEYITAMLSIACEQDLINNLSSLANLRIISPQRYTAIAPSEDRIVQVVNYLMMYGTLDERETNSCKQFLDIARNLWVISAPVFSVGEFGPECSLVDGNITSKVVIDRIF